jgi:small subunit ribosomal protein S4
MGDPKFCRRKYMTPSHPWQGQRIIWENEITKKYGLKNKTELWKIQSLLRTIRERARHLQAKVRFGDKQAEKEKQELIKRMDNLGLLSSEATLDDVLGLNLENILTRRLQTLTYMKGFSNGPKQARQFIVHGHIAIKGRRVTVPGYLVKREEEDKIGYLPSSPISNELHPARPKDELEEGEGPIPAHEEEKKENGTEKKELEPQTPKVEQPAQPVTDNKEVPK